MHRRSQSSLQNYTQAFLYHPRRLLHNFASCLMAKQGEGDPRWVVRERQDGRNVNSWHWEDKDVSSWAKTRIKELLSPSHCSADENGVKISVQSVESVDGDATLYNRKGVLKVLYDLKISGKWSTDHEEKDDCTGGEFKFELFDEDPEVTVTVDPKSRAEHQYRKAFSNKVTPKICAQCGIFVKEMHAGAGQSVDGLTVPGKKKALSEMKATDFQRSGMNQKNSVSKRTTSAAKSQTALVLKDVFACSTSDMYFGLTDRSRLEAITRGRAISEPVLGGKLNLLNGTVQGEYTRLEEGTCVGMTWKLKTWGDNASAGDVLVELETTEESKCGVEVTIQGVPDGDRSSTEGFWRVQIFQAMKIVMGWGSASQFL